MDIVAIRLLVPARPRQKGASCAAHDRNDGGNFVLSVEPDEFERQEGMTQ
jgi:hypothetical protein